MKEMNEMNIYEIFVDFEYDTDLVFFVEATCIDDVIDKANAYFVSDVVAAYHYIKKVNAFPAFCLKI